MSPGLNLAPFDVDPVVGRSDWNTVELPAMRGVFHETLGLNQWMGFARSWGPGAKLQAGLVENSIRLGIPALGGGGGAGGYHLGTEIYNFASGAPTPQPWTKQSASPAGPRRGVLGRNAHLAALIHQRATWIWRRAFISQPGAMQESMNLKVSGQSWRICSGRSSRARRSPTMRSN